jgi:aryl-alcohol dehydrogenase-like predicted oxidoreductase
MKYRQLGHSGVRVSELCLGAMTFGEADKNSVMHELGCDERTSFAIMDRALEAGINFIDTADVYGHDGLSERVIGNWFAERRRRDQVVLATKFRFTMGEGPNRNGGSRYRILRCVEDSLRRLKTDRIDLYQIHCQDMYTPEEETLRALDDLVRQGKVLYLGASNYTAYRLLDSLWLSQTRGLHRFVTLQAQYSLVVRDLEREHVPVCRERGVGILPWAPLAGGFLSGKYSQDEAPPPRTRLGKQRERLARYNTPHHWRILDAVRQVGEELGASPSSVSLAWLLARPTVTSVLFGARSLAQLEDNLKAVDVALATEHVTRLDEVSAVPPGYPYDFIAQVSDGRW